MDINNLILVFFLIGFGILFYKYFLLIINKYNSKLLIDDQFRKTQAFHTSPTPAIAVLASRPGRGDAGTRGFGHSPQILALPGTVPGGPGFGDAGTVPASPNPGPAPPRPREGGIRGQSPNPRVPKSRRPGDAGTGRGDSGTVPKSPNPGVLTRGGSRAPFIFF